MNFTKKTISIFTILTFGLLFSLQAQTAAEAAEKYNKAAGLVNSDIKAAVKTMEEAHQMAVSTDNADIIALSEKQLPSLYYKQTTTLVKEKQIEPAIVSAKSTMEMSTKYGDMNTHAKAEAILIKLYISKGGSFYKAKKFPESLAAYDEALAINQNNTRAYFGKGIVYKASGDTKNMEAAMAKAIETDTKGKTGNKAKKVLAGHFLKTANEALQANDAPGAIENAEKSLTYQSNNKAYYILAVAANRNESFDKAIEAAQKGIAATQGGAESKAGLYFEMGNAYKGKGDNTAACDAYKKAAVGKFAEGANYQIKEVLKCN